MGYPQAGGLLSYFEPVGSAALAEVDLSAAAGTLGEYICQRPCTMKFIEGMVSSVAIVGTTTAPTLVFKKRPTPASSSGESTVGSLTFPTGTAIGKVLYKSVEVDFAVGQSLQVSWTQAVGSPAGKVIPGLQAFDDSESPGNNSNMIASA